MWGCLAQGPISLAQRLRSWESREDRACLKTSWPRHRGRGGLEQARQGGWGSTLLKTSIESPQWGTAWPREGLSRSSSSPRVGWWARPAGLLPARKAHSPRKTIRRWQEKGSGTWICLCGAGNRQPPPRAPSAQLPEPTRDTPAHAKKRSRNPSKQPRVREGPRPQLPSQS